MAATRPLYSTTTPSEDFFLNYDTEVLSMKSPKLSHRHSQIQSPDSKQLTELVIKISGLPHDVTMLELKTLFDKDGSIQYVKVDRDPDFADQRLCATITFSPRPETFDMKRDRVSLLRYTERHPEGIAHSLHVSVISADSLPMESTMCRRDRAYSERLTFELDSVGFGFFYDMHDIRIMHSASSEEDHSNVLILDTHRHELFIQFKDFTNSGGRNLFRLRIPLSHVEQILTSKSVDNSNKFDLIMPLATPPPLYQLEAMTDPSKSIFARSSSQNTKWQRVAGINGTANLTIGAVALPMASRAVNIGAWTTYKISLDATKLNPNLLDEFYGVLREHNVRLPQAPDILRVSKSQMTSCWNWLGTFDMKSSHNTLSLPWQTHYQLEVCVSQGLLSEYSICRDFVARLAAMTPVKASQLLEYIADMNKRVYQPMSIFKLSPPSTVSYTSIPQHCTLLRQAIVTPSTIYFTSPTVEMTNRILRQFSEHDDRFLRVRFSDEKMEGRLWSSGTNSSDPLYERIRNCILSGIRVGGRHYEYLASGNSQFREHGAYFFSSTANLLAADIRYWIGDLREIKTVSKYMSRMGQGFSTTRAIHGTKVVIKEDHDISNNGYTFTDGVGKISQFLAQSIAIELGFPKPSDPPSVFQFRLGGCKGVLALWPDIAKAREIHIRPSQYKFSALHEGLEIIRCSSLACADLNRQLITCLTTLGVPDNTFLSMLRKQLVDLSQAMECEDKAIELLTRRIDGNKMTLQLVRLIQNGFLATKEPFARSLMHLWRTWSLKKLKDKARISIDQGAFVLGCTDESRTLKGHFNSDAQPGVLLNSREECIEALPQIHLRISCNSQACTYKTITGPCIVARNPCLHPGDIRVVNAVDNPQLRHLKDVVVFPQTGDRDIPSMCSGGDLDGDDFLVSWDADLLPPMHMWNVPPMEFTSATPTMKQDVTMEDCAEFFVNHMKYDNLGKIANAWQAVSDASPARAADPKCSQLASLHSTAVDFPKTGVPALLPPDLLPNQYPHFMPSKFRPKNKIYHSKTVLGQIYDEVQGVEYNPVISSKGFDHRILVSSLNGHPYYSNTNSLNVLDSFHDTQEMDQSLNKEELVKALKAKAFPIKQEYDSSIRRIMAQHEIGTESEVWTGFVLAHNQASGDYKFHETIGEMASSLKERFRIACVDAAHEIFSDSEPTTTDIKGVRVSAVSLWSASELDKSTMLPVQNKNKHDTYNVMAPFVQAMYAVTQHEVEVYESLEHSEKASHPVPFISFPWLFSDYLGRMAVENRMPETLISTSVEPEPSIGSEFGSSSQLESTESTIPTMPRAMRVGGGLEVSKHAISSDQEPGSTKARIKPIGAGEQEDSALDTHDLLIDLTPDPAEKTREGILIDLPDHVTTDESLAQTNSITSREDLLDLFTTSSQPSNENPSDLLAALTFATLPYSGIDSNPDTQTLSTCQQPQIKRVSTPPTSPAVPAFTSSRPESESPKPPPPPPSSPSTPVAKPRLQHNSQSPELSEGENSSSETLVASDSDEDDPMALFSRSLLLSPSSSVDCEYGDDDSEFALDDEEDSFADDSGDGDNYVNQREYERRLRYEEEALVLGYDDCNGSSLGRNRASEAVNPSAYGTSVHGDGNGHVEKEKKKKKANKRHEKLETIDEVEEEEQDEELSPLETLGRLVGNAVPSHAG